MSEFSAHATVADRPETARHGKSPGRRGTHANSMRNSHLCIALIPATVMALLGAGVVALVFAQGPGSVPVQSALIMAVAAAACVLIAAALAADAATRRVDNILRPAQWAAHAADDIRRRLGDVAVMVSRGRHDLVELAKRIQGGETPPRRAAEVRPTDSTDPVVRLAHELQQAQDDAWNAVLDAMDTAAGRSPDQRVEVFVSLARRMQALSHRAIQGLDELENQVEDPDLLKGLFRVDHLSTRMRRQAESLAVIGGAVSRRQWSRPVTMYEVLRSAIAEVEQYNRVKVVPPVNGTIDGSAVADVIHLLAELIENATKFAPPQTQVLLRAEKVTAGLAVEVEDRGLGIPRETQRRLNDLLSDFDPSSIDGLLRDGRIGLVVVSALARRHNVAVQLQSNLYGGTQAVVVLPKELMGGESQPEDDTTAQEPDPLAASDDPVPATSTLPSAPPQHAAPAESTPDIIPASTVLRRHAAPAEPDYSTASTQPEYSTAPTDYSTLQTEYSSAQPQYSTASTPSEYSTASTPGEYSAASTASDYSTGGTSTAAQTLAALPDPLPSRSTQARHASPSPMSRPASGGDGHPPGSPGNADRPPLPRRRAQANLAPELRDVPKPEEDGADVVHTPGLMAAFRQGMRSGVEDEDPAPQATDSPSTESDSQRSIH